jgi:hypothetical protein
VQGGCRTRKAAMVGDGYQGRQLAQVHRASMAADLQGRPHGVVEGANRVNALAELANQLR